ncbi:Stp1/IreP family PP2C-type Ser/Thr phosphatase [uncultured Ruminococcus sp.]|uniref:Stp1/IreP family PP2C-type Ser/Thr phosphatase n=1 Tax=uncultured Ruminococcus sp. TaxID=165186 RepID=UPI000EF0FB76|nr:Stp1/IreP family PP2C-type Ser/Thr phosphatase [uncultured Ruminococcus sp.]HCJ40739.1 Stp1/IreP family PP2C-type Ser/Thr phosphatase [Ruminococcus sp.]
MFLAYGTDIGLNREENQDRVRVESLGENICIAAVCDGMGGAASGGVASQLAVDKFIGRVQENFRPDMNENSIRNLLLNAVHYANTCVYEKSIEDIDKNGMGTTCVAALVNGKNIFVVNVGDSRAYLLKKDGISQITSDHTYVETLVQSGKISADAAKVHPMRNVITRAVGVEPDVEVDYFECYESDNFAVVLCSDGLSGYCSDEFIYYTVFGNNLDEAVKKLIDYSNECGGRDNITAAIIAN